MSLSVEGSKKHSVFQMLFIQHLYSRALSTGTLLQDKRTTTGSNLPNHISACSLIIAEVQPPCFVLLRQIGSWNVSGIACSPFFENVFAPKCESSWGTFSWRLKTWCLLSHWLHFPIFITSLWVWSIKVLTNAKTVESHESCTFLTTFLKPKSGCRDSTTRFSFAELSPVFFFSLSDKCFSLSRIIKDSMNHCIAFTWSYKWKFSHRNVIKIAFCSIEKVFAHTSCPLTHLAFLTRSL